MDLNILPQNGPSSPKNSPIDQSSYPPGLLTGPPQSPISHSRAVAANASVAVAGLRTRGGDAASRRAAADACAPGAASREAAT